MILLTIDVGNTHTVFGLFQGKSLLKIWRLPSTKIGILGFKRKLSRGVDSVIVSSVIPTLKDTLGQLSKAVCGKSALFTNISLRMPIKIRTKNPQRVGADRIVNAVGAYTLYKKGKPQEGRHGGLPLQRNGIRRMPLLVIDAGTSTTFDVVTEKGDFLGGVIAPGMKIAADALSERCSQLPPIALQKPKRVLGRDTQAAMQSGIFYGYVGLVEGLIDRIEKETHKKYFVVLTGGLGPLIAKATKKINKLDPNLTLKGLQRLHALNRNLG